MAFDQFPNAARLESLGVARSLRPKAYRAPAVARALGELLNSPKVAKQCKAIAGRFQGGNRLDEACLAVEELGQESAGGEVRSNVVVCWQRMMHSPGGCPGALSWTGIAQTPESRCPR
jgi:hypothetical protein